MEELKNLYAYRERLLAKFESLSYGGDIFLSQKYDTEYELKVIDAQIKRLETSK